MFLRRGAADPTLVLTKTPNSDNNEPLKMVSFDLFFSTTAAWFLIWTKANCSHYLADFVTEIKNNFGKQIMSKFGNKLLQIMRKYAAKGYCFF